jgi:hypothetical protein
MLGKTNATTGGSSGGAGDTVTAINKTGAVINEGDKVWLQKDAHVDTRYRYVDFVGTTTNQSSGFILPSGKYCIVNSQRYEISDDGFTKLDKTSFVNLNSSNAVSTFKDKNNGYIINSKFIDDTGVTAIPFSYTKPCSGSASYFVYIANVSTEAVIYKCDENFNIVRTYTPAETGYGETKFGSYTHCISDGHWYSSATQRYYKLDDETNTYKRVGYFYIRNKYGAQVAYPSLTNLHGECMTSDEKQFVFWFGDGLNILKKIDNTNWQLLTASEVPQKLAKYFQGTWTGATNKNDLGFSYHIANDILVVTYPYASKVVTEPVYDYAVFKYLPEKEKWIEIPLIWEPIPGSGTDCNNLGLPRLIYNASITFSNDMTKMMLWYQKNINTSGSSWTSSGISAWIYDIKLFSDYILVKPNPQILTETTLTGKAKTSADLEGTVEVSTVLPDEVFVEVTAEDDNVTLSME